MPREELTGHGSVHPGSAYTDAEREFMLAMERFKRRTGRRFPTCCDILAVAINLGYRKVEKGPDQ